MARFFKVVIISLILLIVLVAVRGDDAVREPHARPGSVTPKMPIAELRALLAERSVSCPGCVDKRDLVDRVRATLHLPTKSDKIRGELTSSGASYESQIQSDFGLHNTQPLLTTVEDQQTMVCENRYNGTTCLLVVAGAEPPKARTE